ncbi:MAG: oxaloacetate decarboxylase, partial [Parabacteroides sp.]|nr:oxaloacetate decarboxylase [Parabacteroides sp.]MDD4712804.1 oxaloacetate decarboxylase [Bacteroidales bacterium]
VAKNRFEQELEQAKEKAGAAKIVVRPVIEVPSIDIEDIRKNTPTAEPVQAPCSGQVVWQVDLLEKSTAPVVGTPYKTGDTICYVQTYYGFEPVKVMFDGKLLQIDVEQGKQVQKNQVLAILG